MAKTFEFFPGKAAGKGNALVIDDDFQPVEPPVDVSGVPDVLPVEPATEPLVDLPEYVPDHALDMMM